MSGKRQVWLAAACLLTITGPAYGQKGKPSASPCGTGNVPLVVTVFDSPSQLLAGVDPLVTTDGVDPLGYLEYRYEANESSDTDPRPVPLIDGGKGSQKVVAHFEIENCAFDFVVNLNATSRDLVADLPLIGTPIRSEFLRFDRIASVPITSNNPNFTTWCAAGVVDASLQTSEPRDNYGACDVDSGGNWFVRRAAGGYLYEGPARDYRYRFRRSPLDANYTDCQNAALCTASYVRVYRPDASTWVITPDTDVRDIDDNIVSVDPATVSIMSFVDNNETSLLGHETMPFRMMLKVK